MARNGKTTVASQLKKERIIIDGASGKEISRTGQGKKNLEGEKEMTKEEEIKYLQAQIEKLQND